MIGAVALVAFANAFGRPTAVAQSSFALTVTAIPLPSINQACVKQLGPFVNSLGSIDAVVGPSLGFKEYAQMIAGSQTARGQVKIALLDPACIAVFAAAQAALGEYSEAYNTWNDCTTTTACTRPSIESELDIHWATARAMLSSVKASMS